MNNTITNIKMYFLGLIALLSAGKKVFATRTDFVLWMIKRNYFFKDRSPVTYLASKKGLRYVRSQIRTIQYSNRLLT